MRESLKKSKVCRPGKDLTRRCRQTRLLQWYRPEGGSNANTDNLDEMSQPIVHNSIYHVLSASNQFQFPDRPQSREECTGVLFCEGSNIQPEGKQLMSDRVRDHNYDRCDLAG